MVIFTKYDWKHVLSLKTTRISVWCHNVMKNLIDYSGNFDPFLSHFFVINKHLRAISLENALIVVIAWHSVSETFIKLTSSESFCSAKMTHFKILPRNLFGNSVFIPIFFTTNWYYLYPNVKKAWLFNSGNKFMINFHVRCH